MSALIQPVATARAAETPPVSASIEDFWVRGENAYKAGDLETALRLFDAALAIDDKRARSWNYVGGVHFAQGDLSRALTEFRTAVKLDPSDVRALNNLGTVLERFGDAAGAEAAYGKALLVDPSYPVTHRNIGILQLRRLGDPDAARRAWQRYLELAPTGPHADEVRRALASLPDAPPAPAPAPAPPQRAAPAPPPPAR